MKVVLDTNVFISGLMLPDSIPGRILSAWQNTHFEVVLSEPMLEEIINVLSYPKIIKRIKWDQQKIERFALLLRFKTTIVSLDGIEAVVPTDANDNKILATFIAGKADYLISGDQDLLNLKDQYPVVTPGEFSRWL